MSRPHWSLCTLSTGQTAAPLGCDWTVSKIRGVTMPWCTIAIKESKGRSEQRAVSRCLGCCVWAGGPGGGGLWGAPRALNTSLSWCRTHGRHQPQRCASRACTRPPKTRAQSPDQDRDCYGHRDALCRIVTRGTCSHTTSHPPTPHPPTHPPCLLPSTPLDPPPFRPPTPAYAQTHACPAPVGRQPGPVEAGAGQPDQAHDPAPDADLPHAHPR